MFSLNLWKNEAKETQPDDVSTFWKQLNAVYIAYSWLVYIITGIIMAISLYYAYCERCHQTNTTRRRRVMLRARDSSPPKRRPNAAYRDHQINRFIILNLAKYMKNPDGVRPLIDQMDNLYPLRHPGAETNTDTTAREANTSVN